MVSVVVYYSGDVFALFSLAKQQGLMLYVEYIRKKDNVLRIMIVRPITVNEDHVLVTEVGLDNIKRLNYDKVYKMGIEVQEI